MPKAKARKASTSDSDSGPDDKNPVKKAKPTPKAAAKPSSGSGDSGNLTWELGKNRNLSLTEFKGKWYVNIREYYMAADGEMRPGKKGIMLTMEQWQKFKSFLPDLEEAIAANV